MDDTLAFYCNKDAITNLFNDMLNIGLVFDKEDSVTSFLDVHLEHQDNGSIFLSQKSLTKHIIDTLHLSHSSVTPLKVPSSRYISIDKVGEPAHGNFNYASVVCQLNYLQGHT